MQATVELPDAILRDLANIANREGVTTEVLIRRLVEAHVAENRPTAERRFEARLPLIPAGETGPILPVTGADLDEILSRDNFTA